MTIFDFLGIYVVNILLIAIEFNFFCFAVSLKANIVYYLLTTAVLIAVICADLNELAILTILIVLFIAIAFIKNIDKYTAIFYSVFTVMTGQLCVSFSNTLTYLLFLNYPNSVDFNLIYALDQLLPVIISFLLYAILKKYLIKPDNKLNKDLILIILPLFVLLCLEEYINLKMFGNIINYNSVLAGENLTSIVIMQILCLSIIILLVFGINREQRNYKLSQKLLLLNQQQIEMKKYVDELIKKDSGLNAFKHDVANHFLTIGQLLKNKSYDKAMKYLVGADNLINTENAKYKSGNPFADALINNKFKDAESLNIKVKWGLILPYPCSIDDIDLCIIFGNALDNAIKACAEAQGEKIIELKSYIKNGILIIEIANTCNLKGSYEKGIGIGNIETAVKKYGGETEIKAQANLFKLCIILSFTSQ